MHFILFNKPATKKNKPKMGRPPIGKKAMTNSERQKRFRDKKKILGTTAKSQAIF